MRFFVIGSNHTIAPVSVRERFAAGAPNLKTALIELKERAALSEVLLLSTCNRFECYFCADDIEPVIEWIVAKSGFDRVSLLPFIAIYEGSEAITHLFRVASGMDSMVVGETQILKQIKEAFKATMEIGAQGKWLKSLMQATLSAAKAVRHHTQIGHHTVSIPGAVLSLVKSYKNEHQSPNILCIGAGEMISLCVHQLNHSGFQEITIANRSIAQAEALAQQVSGKAMALPLLSPKALSEYDVIISCTASPSILLTEMMMAKALLNRKGCPVLAIDLAVPRDIEDTINRFESVHLYSIDDLGEIVQIGKRNREQATVQADMMITQRAEEFIDWWRHRRHVPLICELQQHAHQLTQGEMDRALRALSQGETPETVLEQFGHRLINKLLHIPIQALHEAAGNDEVASQIAESYGIRYADQPPLTVIV